MSPWSPTPGSPRDCEAWWAKRKDRYDEVGEVGLTEIQTKYMGKPVNTLLYRDEQGILRGIITHFPKAIIPYKMEGEVDLAVDPSCRRQGIGMKLIKKASELWDIQAKLQRYTPASAALTEAYLKEQRENRA